MRYFLTAAIISTLFLTGIWHATDAHAIDTAGVEAQVRDWDPCLHEDGSRQRRCIWDARHMGNGMGHSLIIRRGGTDDARYRQVSHRRAHRLLDWRFIGQVDGHRRCRMAEGPTSVVYCRDGYTTTS